MSTVLTLTRQQLPNNKHKTREDINYRYYNGCNHCTWRGDEEFDIGGIANDGHVITPNLYVGYLPRYRCWYGGPQPQSDYYNSDYEYVESGITGISIRIGPVYGPLQTGC